MIDHDNDHDSDRDNHDIGDEVARLKRMLAHSEARAEAAEAEMKLYASDIVVWVTNAIRMLPIDLVETMRRDLDIARSARADRTVAKLVEVKRLFASAPVGWRLRKHTEAELDALRARYENLPGEEAEAVVAGLVAASGGVLDLFISDAARARSLQAWLRELDILLNGASTVLGGFDHAIGDASVDLVHGR